MPLHTDRVVRLPSSSSYLHRHRRYRLFRFVAPVLLRSPACRGLWRDPCNLVRAAVVRNCAKRVLPALLTVLPKPNSRLSWALFGAEALPLAAGLAGGVWGFLSKTSAVRDQNPVSGEFVRRVIIVAGALSTIGFLTSVGSYQSQPLLVPVAAIFIGGPVGVMVSSALLYTGRRRRRELGILIVVGSIPSLVSSVLLIEDGVAWYFPNYAPGVISFLGSALALILGLRVLGSKKTVLTDNLTFGPPTSPTNQVSTDSLYV